MPKTRHHSDDGFFSYRDRPRHWRVWSPVYRAESPLATTVRDARIWKTVLDRMDVQCDAVQQSRRETTRRFQTTTTADIMAGVTERLDEASWYLADGSFYDKTPSTDLGLVRCKMADGVPEEYLFTLEEEGQTTTSPGDSTGSSTASSTSTSATLTSEGTLVASDGGWDGEWEEGGEPENDRGHQARAFSPAMDCERLPCNDASFYSDGSEDGLEEEEEEEEKEGEEVEEEEDMRSTWRDAICFRQYLSMSRPKMSWRRAHESVRRRKLLGIGGRRGRDNRAWSPSLNVSWTSIEEEMTKQGLVSSPTKLTSLVSPVRIPLRVLMVNGTPITTDMGRVRPQHDRQDRQLPIIKGGDPNQVEEDQRKRKDEIASQPDKTAGQQDGVDVMAMTGREPVKPAEKGRLGVTEGHAGVARNTDHGENLAEPSTRKDERLGGTAVTRRNGEPVSLMEQYVTAQPFVPEDKPKECGPQRGRVPVAAPAKAQPQPRDTENPPLASRTGGVPLKSERPEQKATDRKLTQVGLQGQHQVGQANVQASLEAKTFRREQLPIPVIEHGVVHHRHPSPPATACTQQTTEGVNARPGQETRQQDENQSQAGERTAAGGSHVDRLKEELTNGPHAQPLVVPNRSEERYNNAPNPQQQHQRPQDQHAFGQDPGVLGRQPALWNPGAGDVSMTALAHQQLPPRFPPQIPNHVPFNQVQLANLAAGMPQYQNHNPSHQPFFNQGMPNHVQLPFPNGRHHPQEQFLPMMQPPQPPVPPMQQQQQQPFANGYQQDQFPAMQMPTFQDGRPQDQVTRMQPQQPFANGFHLPHEQLPVMQGQQRPSVMLDDPCIVYAQPNIPPSGQNNNNLHSGHQQPRPPAPDSTNQQNLNKSRGYQLGPGHPYQLNLRHPLHQPHPSNHNRTIRNTHGGNNQNGGR